MAGTHYERLDGMASRIYLFLPSTNTAYCAAAVSLSVRVMPNVSVSLV